MSRLRVPCACTGLAFPGKCRPPIPEDTQEEVRRLYGEENVSINQIAERLDIAYGTAWNYVQKVKSD